MKAKRYNTFLLTIVLSIMMLTTSCVSPNTSTRSSSTPAPYLSTTLAIDETIFSGPGNTGYQPVGALAAGEKVYLLGEYVDFVKIQRTDSDVQGYIRKNSLYDIPAGVPILTSDEVPMKTQDLFKENCMGPFSIIDEDNTATMQSPGLPDGGSFGIHGGVTWLTDKTILRLQMSTTGSGLGSLWIQDLPSTSYELPWVHRVLEIKIVNHVYEYRIMDGSGADFFYDNSLGLSEDEVLVIELLGETANKIRMLDVSGNILEEIDIQNLYQTTTLKQTTLENGLFPFKQINITCAVNTPSDFILKQRSIESLPDGEWQIDTTNTSPGLQGLAQAYDIDMMIPMENWLGDPHYYEIYKNNFGVDILTNTSAPFFWTDVGVYNFEFLDQIIDYDLAQGWKVAFTFQNYNASLPASLINSSLTRDEYIQILHEYVTTIVSRYKDKVYMWLIAPEAISFYVDSGDTTVDFWEEKIGLDYIEMMLKWAREADPDGILLWADGAYASSGNDRFERVYQMMLSRVKDYKERGVPLDAVGIGGSFYIFDWWMVPPSKDNLIETMRSFAELGVDVYIPETEVSLTFQEGSREEKWAFQADAYKTILDACIESEVCRGIGIFQVRDSDSWLNCPEGHIDPCPLTPAPEPLLFDDYFNPKPAYFAMVESFTSH